MTSHSAVTVPDLARVLDARLVGSPDVSLSGISYDSRKVRPGDLFCCVPGEKTDGHLYAEQAVAAGAAALLVERELEHDRTQLVVGDARLGTALAAAEIFGRPAESMLMLGVTGTNGKTTTTFLLESILRAEGQSAGLIGTIETHVGDEVRPGVRTTPDSVDLQELLAEMVTAGVRATAMEVTSHALVLHRVEAIRFAAVGFTNLSQDHLDFHSGMEDYFNAKRELFTAERADKGAINIDDPYGNRLAANAEIPCIGYGIDNEAEVRGRAVSLGPTGSTFTIDTPKGSMQIETPLVGSFNVYNCLGAAAIALQAGIGLETIEKGLRELRAVPGRFESIDAGQPFAVIVDYAHTPDSLDNVLRAARDVASRGNGRVICAFGAGGDRDRAKRPLMGAVAARLADYVIVTSDNPRSEDPQSILDQILEGVLAESANGPDLVSVDRRDAVFAAVDAAAPGDVVVIAGKGHETGQEFATETLPFDDRDVAREALADAGWSA